MKDYIEIILLPYIQEERQEISFLLFCFGDSELPCSVGFAKPTGVLASFPGLPRGEGRPGTHCSRMRGNFKNHPRVCACMNQRR